MITFDLQGKLLYKHKLGGMIEQMAIANDKVVFAIARNVRTKEVAVRGLYILSLVYETMMNYASMLDLVAAESSIQVANIS